MYVACVQVPVETRRGYWIPWELELQAVMSYPTFRSVKELANGLWQGQDSKHEKDVESVGNCKYSLDS